MLEEKERLREALLWIILLASFVFLALCELLWVVGSWMELVAALLWLRVVWILLFFQITTFVQLLGFLEDLVEVKLSNDVLLGIKYFVLASMCECV